MGSDLTREELRIAAEAEIDLGVGYPEFHMPPWLAGLWLETSLKDLVTRYVDETPGVSPGCGGALPAADLLARELIRAVLRYLRLDPALERQTFITSSGSLALERVIATVTTIAPSVITTSPSIDIIPAMLLERPHVSVRYLLGHPQDGRAPNFRDVAVDRSLAESTVLLTSPENPTGTVVTSEALEHLSTECRNANAPLVIDQCFCKISAGPAVPLLPSHVAAQPFAFIWDTGKTFDLDDDKLGFVICGGDLLDAFRARLSVLQCTLPKRKLMLMKLVLDAAEFHEYDRALNGLVAGNIEELRAELSGTNVQVHVPEAGGFVLLDVSAYGLSDRGFSTGLLREQGVGVVPGSLFFHSASHGRAGERFVRLAVVRDRVQVGRGASRIRDYVRDLEGRSPPRQPNVRRAP